MNQVRCSSWVLARTRTRRTRDEKKKRVKNWDQEYWRSWWPKSATLLVPTDPYIILKCGSRKPLSKVHEIAGWQGLRMHLVPPSQGTYLSSNQRIHISVSVIFDKSFTGKMSSMRSQCLNSWNPVHCWLYQGVLW